MIRLFQFLRDGCWHIWETVLVNERFERADSPLPYGRHYHCKCNKCGYYRKFEL